MMLVVGGAKRATTRPPAVVEAVPPSAAPQFVPLFNGRDLTGWHAGQGRADAWAVSNGILAGTRKSDTDDVLLSDAAFADFELRLEYRWPRTGGHTVVLLRAADAKPFVSDCLAVNIGDDENFPAVHGRAIGGLYRTGLVPGVSFDPPPANKPIGQWNVLQITARGRTIDVKLNGTAMPTATVPAKWAQDASKAGKLRPSGSIGLVCHWGLIDYRNVTIRALAE